MCFVQIGVVLKACAETTSTMAGRRGTDLCSQALLGNRNSPLLGDWRRHPCGTIPFHRTKHGSRALVAHWDADHYNYPHGQIRASDGAVSRRALLHVARMQNDRQSEEGHPWLKSRSPAPFPKPSKSPKSPLKSSPQSASAS